MFFHHCTLWVKKSFILKQSRLHVYSCLGTKWLTKDCRLSFLLHVKATGQMPCEVLWIVSVKKWLLKGYVLKWYKEFLLKCLQCSLFIVNFWNLIQALWTWDFDTAPNCVIQQADKSLTYCHSDLVRSCWGALIAVIVRRPWTITHLLPFHFEKWKAVSAVFFVSLFSSASLFLSLFFFSLPASPLPHQFNSGVLSKAFPQVVSLDQNPTPLSLVQLQQEGEDIFIGLWGDISMAAIVSRSIVV